MALPTLAVTGATGQVGGRVARRLADRGVGQRLVVPQPERAPRLDRAEVVPGSYGGDTAQLRRAFDGMSTLFLISGREDENRLQQHLSAVDAAIAAGVERIVYLSFINAAADATFTFARDHWHTEQHIRESGVRFAFLRDNLYMQAFPIFTGQDGVIRGPGGDGRVGAVAHDDIADVAVAALLNQSLADDVYDVTGPEALSLSEAAEQLSTATGRTITYHAETLEEAYASRASFGAPEWEVRGWVTTYQAIALGEMDVVRDTVQKLTGHEPMGFAEYLQRNPETYRHLLPS